MQRSYALEWEARTDHPCVPALNILTPLVPLAAVFCFHGCSHATFPKSRFPTALQLLNAASTCTLSETLFNNTFLRTHAPFRSFTFLLNVGTESLNTSVRVCFAQPSHSGAECDPRHRGAVFCIGIQPPQRTTFHWTFTGSHGHPHRIN